jgi:hypothetical protein
MAKNREVLSPQFLVDDASLFMGCYQNRSGAYSAPLRISAFDSLIRWNFGEF